MCFCCIDVVFVLSEVGNIEAVLLPFPFQTVFVVVVPVLLCGYLVSCGFSCYVAREISFCFV